MVTIDKLKDVENGLSRFGRISQNRTFSQHDQKALTDSQRCHLRNECGF